MLPCYNVSEADLLTCIGEDVIIHSCGYLHPSERRIRVMEEKEYYTYEEALEILGISRSTLFTMINDLGIQWHKFKYDKRRYLANADVKRLKEIREKPWTVEEKKPEDSPA
jgi:hypothetical protein